MLDDIYAVGALLYSMLVGRPPDALEPVLPEEVAAALPVGTGSVLRRCVSPDPTQRFRDPNELKTELLQVVESARSVPPATPGGPGSKPGIPVAASIEVMEETPAPLPVNRPAQQRRKKPRATEQGGFVIPELRPVAQVEDDGTKQRWLVERDGVDYGPYTRDRVVEELREEKINAETVLYDIETDRRLGLSEFTAFDEALLAWSHERADLEQQRAEQASVDAARRRTRMALTIIGGLALVTGLGLGGWFWHQASKPKPEQGHLDQLVVAMSSGLPPIPLPDEELPETAAEKRDRLKAERASRRRAANRADRRRAIEEARLAASSELNVGSATGRGFERAAFDRVVGRRYARLTKCLQKEAARNPSARNLNVKITVIPTGRLINVHMPSGTEAANRCTRAALAGLRVPAFDGTNHSVTLPFSIK